MSKSIINIGEVPACGEAVALPIEATATGTWAFMTTFNKAYQYIQFQATEGENIVVPAKLNEDYLYTFKLFQPDNSLLNDSSYCMTTIPMLPDIDYVCPSADGTDNISVGKLQFEAEVNQGEVSYLELNDAKQIAVFIEGTMRHEGDGADEYTFSKPTGTIVFNTSLTELQKVTILYFK